MFGVTVLSSENACTEKGHPASFCIKLTSFTDQKLSLLDFINRDIHKYLIIIIKHACYYYFVIICPLKPQILLTNLTSLQKPRKIKTILKLFFRLKSIKYPNALPVFRVVFLCQCPHSSIIRQTELLSWLQEIM